MAIAAGLRGFQRQRRGTPARRAPERIEGASGEFLEAAVGAVDLTADGSAVELRYAPFLWMADLSEPENLFLGMIPFIGAINILPVLMAGTMALQTYLTPSAGDPAQQKMMLVMMPIMMLFMFYSFPSALSLYWTVSQVLSIVQMLMMRRKVEHEQHPNGDITVDSSMTRQQRRSSVR
jgi:membrane protein insertase Oxa1/YidC/SpoIIIJ